MGEPVTPIEGHGDPTLNAEVVRLDRGWGGGPLYHLDRILGADLFELSASMTLLMVALSLHEPIWQVYVGVVTLAVSGLIIRSLLRSPLFWFSLGGIFLLSYSVTWYVQNNHDFLKLYWCLGIGVSLLVANPMRAVRFNARMLIGLCFAFAVVWKLVSPDYLSNEFFNYFILHDTRFKLIAEYVGKVNPVGLVASQIEQVLYTAFGDPEGSLTVPLATKVAWIAPILTWWTLFIETAIAVTFLVPTDWRVSEWRDSALLIFIFTTYFVSPVLYFAWLLIAMAVSQCDRAKFRYWPVLYTAAFVLILIRYHVPV